MIYLVRHGETVWNASGRQQGSTRRWIGTALMRDLMRWAEANPSLRKIELLVRATNFRASLYTQNWVYRRRPIQRSCAIARQQFH
jgi:hypothetical protein